MKPRYTLLDGLRGTAAMVVMVFHFTQPMGKNPIPFAGLSVDLFFLLSGFVLEHAYGQKLRSGMMITQFMRLRLVRLYPLYFVGLCLGVLAEAKNFRIFLPFGIGVLMIPDFLHSNLFPLNLPSWSLFDELAMNVVFAWALIRGIRMEVFCAIGLLAMCYCWSHGISISGGWMRDNWYTGLIRVSIWFSLGAVIYRIRGLRRLPELPKAVSGFFVWMGAISYALYMVHYPIMRATSKFVGLNWVSVSEGMALAIALASILTLRVEPALRRWLSSTMCFSASRKATNSLQDPLSEGIFFRKQNRK